MTKKRTISWLLTLAMLVTIIPGTMLTASAANRTAQTTTVNQTAEAVGDVFEPLSAYGEKVTFIVEVEGDPLAVKYGVEAVSDTEKTEEILIQQEKVMTSIHNEIDNTAKKGFVYTAVFNGFSMEGTIDQLEEIKALDGVKNVYISSEVQIIEPVEEPEVTPMIDCAEEMTGVTAAHDSGYTGKGTVIAIIDTGCDTSHDFFKAAPENPRYSISDIDNLVKTRPLNADAASGNQVYKNEKIPYAYNYTDKTADTYVISEPHGTHVAGIAAGKNGVAPDGSLFSGVAPDAQLLILCCSAGDGMLSDDAILAALNDAVLLEADVVNMSFGSTYIDVLCEDIFKEALSNCREAGISLLASNGNASRGYNYMEPATERPDYGTNGTPAGEPSVTAVASVNNSKQWYKYITLEAPDGIVYEANTSNDADSLKSAFNSLEEGEYLEYVDCGLGYPEDFSDVTGKLALIKRGELTYTDKAKNAKAAGAVGILVYNYIDESMSMTELGMPAASLPESVGLQLLARTDKSLRYKDEGTKRTETLNPAMIAYDSSWGVDSTLELKPEISAPGGKIYSSVLDNKYATYSGTSMAAPHMSGVAALSREYYATNPFISAFNGKTGSEKTDLIENLAMNSASIIRQKNDVAYSPRLQGAGLVNMEGILKSRVLLKGDSGKAKLSLGDDLEDTLNLAFDITNIDEGDITFDKITVEVLTDGYKEGTEGTEGYLVSDSVAIEPLSVKMPESVTVPSGDTVKFEAEVKLDDEFLANNEKIFTNGFYIDGYVILESKSDSTLKASLPFTGFYGDWGASPIFDSTVYDEEGSYLVDSPENGITGTFLATTYSWGSVALGRNPFFGGDFDKKHISYSTNGRGKLGLIMNNFRAVKDFTYSIVDSDGNTVVSNKFTAPLAKFISYLCNFPYNKISELEEGEYSIVAKATVLGDTDRTDELRIPFTVDNSYPEILSAVYDEEEKTVTVKAKENHYISAVYIGYTVDSKSMFEEIQVFDDDYAQDGSVTKVFDVSMIPDISDAVIGCVDFALNETYYDIDYFMDKIGAELVGSERLKAMTQAEFNIRNNTSEDVSADFVLAFYDDDDRLITTNMIDCKIGANDEEELLYAFLENTQDAAYVKLFVWDFAQQKPIDKLKQFTLD